MLGACLVGGVLVTAGCPAGGANNHCVIDTDCGDQVCAITGECVGTGTVRTVRIRWQVANQSPTPQAPELCGAISDLEVSFRDRDGLEDGVSYWPVPCELGTVFYNHVPSWLDRLRIVAFDSADSALDEQVFSLEGPEITVTPNF